VDATCDLQFSLWDALSDGGQVGSTLTRTSVEIREGLFTVADLDFGAGAFNGDARWLEVAVQCSGDTSFTVLSPRQALTATPYASYAAQVGAHSHLGETWTGSDNPLTLGGSFGGAPLVLNNSSGDGMVVDSAGSYGMHVGWAGLDGMVVGSAGDDGVIVYSTGSPSATVPSDQKNGVEVAGAEGHGLYVGQAENDGVHVHSAGWDGVYVSDAGWDGVYVGSAGNDGVIVYRAGSPSWTLSSDQKNGVEVAGAEDNGLYVGWADNDGVQVLMTGRDGVNVLSAGDVGVYASTARYNHEWGFYTPDKIYAGSALAAGGPSMIVAQNGDCAPLEPGTVVVVSGVGAPFAGSDFPAPLVRRAGARHGAVAGVVYARFVAEEEVEEVEHDGQTEQRTSLHSRSAEGPIAPGETLLVVVLGPAQVKASALAREIRPGDLLVVGGDGQAAAMPAGSAYVPGTIVGTAMEALEVAQGSGLIWVLVQPR
jgi:hypothetical protein